MPTPEGVVENPWQDRDWWRSPHAPLVPSRAAASPQRVQAGQGHVPAVAHGINTPEGLTSRVVTPGVSYRDVRACGHLMEGETTTEPPISVPRPEETR
jgi:hypothetical protein